MISDQIGLVVHLPEMGDDAMGYHAVGSGLFLFVLAELAGEEPRTVTRQAPDPARRVAAGGLRPAGRAARRTEKGV